MRLSPRAWAGLLAGIGLPGFLFANTICAVTVGIPPPGAQGAIAAVSWGVPLSAVALVLLVRLTVETIRSAATPRSAPTPRTGAERA